MSDEELRKKIQELERRVRALENYLEEFPAFDSSESLDVDNQDDLYEKALWLTLQTEKVSASYLQRRLQIGYNRAIRLMDALAENQIIEPYVDSKPSTVLVKKKDLDNLKEKLEKKLQSTKEEKKKN